MKHFTYPEALEPFELADITDCPVTLLVSEYRSLPDSSRSPSKQNKNVFNHPFLTHMSSFLKLHLQGSRTQLKEITEVKENRKGNRAKTIEILKLIIVNNFFKIHLIY